MAEAWQVARLAAPLRMQVVELLREAIAAGEFEPGERLVEAPLCKRLSVSRTVVREAIRQLEAEGLVSIVANRGPVVAILSDMEARALYEVRAALEGLAGSLFAQRAGDQQCRQLKAALAKVAKAYESEDRNARLSAKDRFYEILLDGANNPIIRTTLRSIHTRVQFLRGLSMQEPGRREQSLKELAAVVDAVIQRDAEAARLACEDHVRKAADIAIPRLENSRDSEAIIDLSLPKVMRG